MTTQALLDQLNKKIASLPAKDRHLINQAFDFAHQAHQGMKRESGEPYIHHPLHVTLILSHLAIDGPMLAAALLHDVVEDTAIPLTQIEKKFGQEVAQLVDGVIKLAKIKIKRTPTFWPHFLVRRQEERFSFEHQVKSLQKMFLAISGDLRVIFIKLADRLHNMRTLHLARPDKRARIAQETLEIYAPIANRLGIGELKGELEDLAFPFVYPQEYQNLKKRVEEIISEREKYVDEFIKLLKRFLESKNIIIVDIHGRAKHLYSLWNKLRRYDNNLEKIYDLVAVRIIVKNVADCYQALGLIHSRWNPLIGRIKDYIAMPKPNGYQSLHTTIFSETGQQIEIQIRTPRMHARAEHGIAAHWSYKEQTQKTNRAFQDVQWIKQFNELRSIINDHKEIKQILELDFFSDRIFAFTPKGDVINLPRDASVIDFAYAIHSDIGNACTGAKINGQIKPLATRLENGDIVEIITQKNSRGPKADWLKFTRTQKARAKIKQILKIR